MRDGRWRLLFFSAMLWGVVFGFAKPAQGQEQAAGELEERFRAIEQKMMALERRLDSLERSEAGGGKDVAIAPAELRWGAEEPVLETMEQRLQALEARREPPQLAAPAPAPATIAEAGGNGFVLRSSDGDFRLNLRYQLNLDGRFGIESQGGASGNSFFLRRTQPILQGTVFRRFDFFLLSDFGKGRAGVNDAYLDILLWPGLRLRAGKYKGPVGLERLQSGMMLPMMERALPTSLVPNRDLGVQLYGVLRDGTLEYAAGLFNGAPDGASIDGDGDDLKEFEGRFFLRPFRQTAMEPLQMLGFGLGGSFGSARGTASAPNLPTFRTTGQRAFFQYRSGAVADGDHTRLAPQANYYWRGFGLLGEYTVSSQQVRRGASRRRLDHAAWHVMGSYVLTGEDASYNGVLPAKLFDPSQGHWGALELVARFSRLNVDKTAFPDLADSAASAESARSWAVGLNWYLNRSVKFVLNYEQTRFTGGEQPAEKIFLQRFQFRM